MVRALSAVLLIMAVISTSFAVVTSLALRRPPTESLLFAFWCAALALTIRQLFVRWLASARYIVTEHHVITVFGPFRRSIERRSISFARIFWNPAVPNAGDLELVRAVPIGALRRRLLLRLSGVLAPDRVWAIIRGAEDVAPIGHAARPLTQRLDHGERVIWSARPRPKLRTYLPHGQREWLLLGMAGLLFLSLLRMLEAGIPALGKVVSGGLPATSFAFLALALGLSLAASLILAIACYLVYDAVIRPGYSVKHTRYLITNKRVLIQRGNEELHLDRGKIVDVIDTPLGDGLSHVFLVLDGPRARALAASGAFGELGRGPHLRPVFESVADAEGVSRVLQGVVTESVSDADSHYA